MKNNLLLGLLLSGSLAAWGQTAPPPPPASPVRLSCLEPVAAGRPANPAPTPTGTSNVAPPTDPGGQVSSCPGVINVNIHFMLRLDGTGNFNETDDGVPYMAWNDPTTPIPADTANNGYARARQLVTEMNNQAATNPLNANPAGTANPPKGFSYALNGVYFHRVPEDEFRIVKATQENVFTPLPFTKYGINKASEINLFICGDYQDANVSTYDVGGVACTIGYDPNNPSTYWAKLFNTHSMYEWEQIHNGDNTAFPGSTVVQDSYRPTANSLGHEIGHIIGLYHTFNGANGCTDAAVANSGNGWNNQMDYTGGNGTALTPCQLGVVNYNLYNPGNPTNSFYNYLSSSTCGEVPPRAFFVMPACQYTGNVRMDSRGTFMADQMTIRIYAHDPTALTGQGALLGSYTRPVAQGGRWNLATLFRFTTGQTYVVALTAQRNSGQQHTRTQVFTVYAPGTAPCDSIHPIDN